MKSMSLNRNNRFNWLKSHVSELLFYECPTITPWSAGFYSLNYFIILFTNITNGKELDVPEKLFNSEFAYI